MTRILDSGWRAKTRRKHQCWHCCRIIPIGSKCEYQSQIHEGEPATVYTCKVCVVTTRVAFRFNDYAYVYEPVDSIQCSTREAAQELGWREFLRRARAHPAYPHTVK